MKSFIAALLSLILWDSVGYAQNAEPATGDENVEPAKDDKDAEALTPRREERCAGTRSRSR